jgi:hypothetical protein
MPEGLATADGKPVDIPAAANVEPDADWAAHMAQAARNADTVQAPAPPKKEPADPEAPYGRTADGKPKKGPGGRPPKKKAEQPRVAAPTAAQGVKKDFTEPLTGLVQLAWGVLATTSPADAGAVKVAGPGMVTAWNNLAQENAQIARGIEWLTSGSAYGAVVMATAPLVFQIMANHGRVDPARVAALGVHDPKALAEMTKADVQEMAAAAQAA